MTKINETFVKGVSAPNRPNKLYYDEDLKGFALRVTKAGAKAFVLNYSIHGRERRQTIGGYPGWSAKAAREEAKSLRRQVDRGSIRLKYETKDETHRPSQTFGRSTPLSTSPTLLRERR